MLLRTETLALTLFVGETYNSESQRHGQKVAAGQLGELTWVVCKTGVVSQIVFHLETSSGEGGGLFHVWRGLLGDHFATQNVPRGTA